MEGVSDAHVDFLINWRLLHICSHYNHLKYIFGSWWEIIKKYHRRPNHINSPDLGRGLSLERIAR
ncbi:hypothetical protein PSZ91_24000, partial [Shigella sonnei]|nr:hypothetical protein [Shigella sonnei]